MQFNGAKVAVFLGDKLLVMRRDARADIPWPGTLDWPGGGREGDETPQQTAIRETFEEVALQLTSADLQGQEVTTKLGVQVVKFIARLPASRVADVKLGDEGQCWALMTPAEFAAHGDGVPSLVTFAREALGLGWPDKDTRIACRTPARDRDGVTNIPAWKFHLMRGWMRELVLRAGPKGLPFKGLAAAVSDVLSDGDRARLGSVGWHMTCAKLEMEVRGELARAPGPGPQRILPGPAFLSVVTGDI